MGGKVTPEYQKSYRERRRIQLQQQRKEYRKTPEYKKWLDETRETRTVKVTARQRARKESGYEEWLKYQLKSCKSREKTRPSKTCTLTLEELVKQYHKQNGLCGISGLPLEWKQESLMSISIDRIDNSLGYHSTNIHLVAKWLNIGRGTASLDEIRSIMHRISQMEQTHFENSVTHENK